MKKEKLREPYLDAEVEITQILVSDVIQTSGESGGSDNETWSGENTPSSGWT